MDVSERQIENLEQILKNLLSLVDLAQTTHPHHLHMWLDLAITETRAQIERARTETIH
jgi:hypothetical protein